MQSPSPGHSLRHNWRWCVDITCFSPYMVYFNDSSMRWLLFVNHDEVFWGTLHLALTRAIMRSPITRPAPSGRFFYWRHHWWYGVDGQGSCSPPLAEKSCFHWSEPGEPSHCLIEIVFAFENYRVLIHLFSLTPETQFSRKVLIHQQTILIDSLIMMLIFLNVFTPSPCSFKAISFS